MTPALIATVALLTLSIAIASYGLWAFKKAERLIEEETDFLDACRDAIEEIDRIEQRIARKCERGEVQAAVLMAMLVWGRGWRERFDKIAKRAEKTT